MNTLQGEITEFHKKASKKSRLRSIQIYPLYKPEDGKPFSYQIQLL